jgi:hypothetical protein
VFDNVEFFCVVIIFCDKWVADIRILIIEYHIYEIREVCYFAYLAEFVLQFIFAEAAIF